MRIGVFTVLVQNIPFEQALRKIADFGVSEVEVGSCGYAGEHQRPVDELQVNELARQRYLEAIERRGLIISSFSCHYEPLHPDENFAKQSDKSFRRSFRLPPYKSTLKKSV